MIFFDYSLCGKVAFESFSAIPSYLLCITLILFILAEGEYANIYKKIELKFLPRQPRLNE
jgi:hypothetical protein